MKMYEVVYEVTNYMEADSEEEAVEEGADSLMFVDKVRFVSVKEARAEDVPS